MKLASLQAFVAVLECGSIHAGARKLGVSQPALSKTLRALEDELGVQLVTRTSRGTVATAYGRSFLARAQLVVREVELAREEVEQLKGNLRGSLSISVTPATAIRLLPDSVHAFRQDCPEIKLCISEALQPEAAELVRSNAVELALAPVDRSLPTQEFRMEPLITIPMGVVMRRDHPLASANTISELLSADWLQISPSETLSRTLQRWLDENNVTDTINPVVSCQSLSSALILMRSSDLLTILPLSLLELPLLSNDFVQVKPTGTNEINNQIGLIYRADSPMTPAAQIMANHIRRVSGKQQ